MNKTFTCVFANGDVRSGLSFEESWSLFHAYRHTSNPCTVQPEALTYKAP